MQNALNYNPFFYKAIVNANFIEFGEKHDAQAFITRIVIVAWRTDSGHRGGLPQSALNRREKFVRKIEAFFRVVVGLLHDVASGLWKFHNLFHAEGVPFCAARAWTSR